MKQKVIFTLVLHFTLTSQSLLFAIDTNSRLDYTTENYGKDKQEDKDSIAVLYIIKAEKFASNGKHKKASKMYDQAYEIAGNSAYIKQKCVEYHLSRKNYKKAANFINLSELANHQYNEKAIAHYYKGLILMMDGWYGKHAAHQSFMAANNELKRSPNPDVKLWSQILNACGYTNIVARQHSRKDDSADFCLVHPREMALSYPYFYYALEYDPDNESAKSNMDSLVSKLQRIHYPLPDLKGFLPTMKSLPQVAFNKATLDSIDMKSEFSSLIFSNLPKNIETVVKYLNEYDEVVFVMDYSSSMTLSVNYNEFISRDAVIKELSQAILFRVDPMTMISAVTVSGMCYTAPIFSYQIGAASRSKIALSIVNTQAIGMTPLNRIIKTSPFLFSGKDVKRAVLLFSDGMDSCGEALDLCSTAALLNAYKIDFSVFSFLLEGVDEYEYALFECMTSHSKGKVFQTSTSGQIEEAFVDEEDKKVEMVLPYIEMSNIYPSHEFLFQFDVRPFLKKSEVTIKLSNDGR